MNYKKISPDPDTRPYSDDHCKEYVHNRTHEYLFWFNLNYVSLSLARGSFRDGVIGAHPPKVDYTAEIF